MEVSADGARPGALCIVGDDVELVQYFLEIRIGRVLDTPPHKFLDFDSYRQIKTRDADKTHSGLVYYNVFLSFPITKITGIPPIVKPSVTPGIRRRE